jgi:Carboxypeptidase regulatory-like domain
MSSIVKSIASKYWILQCLAALSAVSGLAQDRGTIRGILMDESGAAVPGASVSVANVDTGLTQTLTSGADGRYEAIYLPCGNLYRRGHERKVSGAFRPTTYASM